MSCFLRTIAVLLSVSLVVLPGSLVSQSFVYTDAWGPGGLSVDRAGADEVSVSYSITGFSISQSASGNETEVDISLDGYFLPNEAGAPNLPGKGWYVAVPLDAEPYLVVEATRTEKLEGVKLAPAPEIPMDTDQGQDLYKKNLNIYNSDEFYPSQPVALSEVIRVRGVDAVMVGVTPFQYNPVDEELIIYRDIRFRIGFRNGSGEFGDDRLRSRHWDPILSDLFINWPSIRQVDYSSMNISNNARSFDGCEYLIISPDGTDFVNWADTIKKFRTGEGILTHVTTLSDIGGNSFSAIEAYIDDAYNNWAIPPVAVLLLGDYGTDPSNSIVSDVLNDHPGGYNPYISDNSYADVDGDHLPDVMLARITARNQAELEVMINKFINYECNPPLDSGFYDHPVTALGWQTSRWFQLCSEVAGGFFKNSLGKNPVRVNAVYQGNPDVDPWSTAGNTSTVLGYFGESGLDYIPDYPSVLGGWTGGNATAINNALNSGAFLLQHRDHGYYAGWGEPAYNNSSINGLANTDLTYVLSINCQTGKFNNSSECFAEKFHRYNLGGTGAGALGILAASEVSYSFVNDIFTWGLYDYLWPEFMPDYASQPVPRGLLPGFANVAGKYHLSQSNWYNSSTAKKITYYLFHHHGDAFMTLYSEVPQPLTVLHDTIITTVIDSFLVTADSGAFVSLTCGGDILATATSDGTPLSLNINTALIPGNDLTVTATKRNHIRYSAKAEVVPALGPFVLVDTVLVHDSAFNNDGLPDYGESGTLSVQVRNVGESDAQNVRVVISSPDPWLTLSPDTVTYGMIPSGHAAVLAGAYNFSVAPGVADGDETDILVMCFNDSTSWDTYYSLEAHSPVFGIEDIAIGDTLSGDGNGFAEPGEVCNITVTIINSGSTSSDSIIAILSTSDSGIDILDSIAQCDPVPEGNSSQFVFKISSDPGMNLGTEVAFHLYIADARGFASVVPFDLNLGRIPVLVVDLDPNHNSAGALKAAVEANGVNADYASELPGDLSLYSSVFVCLGIYSSNHILSVQEGSILEDYLNNGGRVYLEGGDTWAFDSQTPVHPLFHIDPLSDGSSDLDSLRGATGTGLEGLEMEYLGENSWIDRIGATGSAQVVLNNNDPVYGSSVWYDGVTYKTIGASHEFGGISGYENRNVTLMAEYLRFFDISITSEWIGINSNWNDPVNWSNGVVPDEETHVIIPANPSRGGFPTGNDSGEARCKTLTLEDGALLAVPSGTTMTVYQQGP